MEFPPDPPRRGRGPRAALMILLLILPLVAITLFTRGKLAMPRNIRADGVIFAILLVFTSQCALASGALAGLLVPPPSGRQIAVALCTFLGLIVLYAAVLVAGCTAGLRID